MDNFIAQALQADKIMAEVHQILVSDMDWRSLYFGHVGKDEVAFAVKDAYWQHVRLSMKGMTLLDKYQTLQLYLRGHKEDRLYQVRVTNYVTALSRGGLIKPSDYLGG